MTTARIEASISMKAKTVRQAIDALAHGGYIRIEFGARNARNHYHVRPYRETEENGHQDDDENLRF